MLFGSSNSNNYGGSISRTMKQKAACWFLFVYFVFFGLLDYSLCLVFTKGLGFLSRNEKAHKHLYLVRSIFFPHRYHRRPRTHETHDEKAIVFTLD